MTARDYDRIRSEKSVRRKGEPSDRVHRPRTNLCERDIHCQCTLLLTRLTGDERDERYAIHPRRQRTIVGLEIRHKQAGGRVGLNTHAHCFLLIKLYTHDLLLCIC